MKTNIKILMDGKEKIVYQDEFTGRLFVKYNGEQLNCYWLSNDLMVVAFYGNANII